MGRRMGPRWQMAAAVAVMAFAGCSSAPARHGEEEPGGQGQGLGPGNYTAYAPVLELGQSWTYRLGGYWDSLEAVTAVVAYTSPEAYLIAAAEREQLTDEIVWDQFYLGPVDRQLRALDGNGELRPVQWLHFPMSNGTTWELRPGSGLNLTAHAQTVDTPDGPRTGFAIAGSSERSRIEMTYVPSLGAVTHFADYEAGESEPGFLWDLVDTGTQSTWAWFEGKPRTFGSALFGDPASVDPMDPKGTLPFYQPASFQVTDNDDQVVVWGVASEGSRGTVVRPAPDQPWTFDGQGVPNYVQEFFPATPGTWEMSGHPGGQDGWVYLQAQVVSWVDGP